MNNKYILFGVFGFLSAFLVGGALNVFGSILALALTASWSLLREVKPTPRDCSKSFSTLMFFGLSLSGVANNEGLANFIKFLSGFSSLLFN